MDKVLFLIIIIGRNKFLPFAPNLTMNLTYLCSGFINVFFPSVTALVCRLKDDFMDKVLFLIIIIVKNKKEE